MKILQVHDFYRIPGGEDAVVQSERELLERNGHTVISYYRYNQETEGYGIVRKAGFFREALLGGRAIGEVGRLIDSEKPDLCHVHNVFPLISPSLYPYVKRRGVPLVQTVHNYRFLCPNGLFYTGGGICRRCAAGSTVQCFIRRCYRDSRILSGLYAFIVWYHRRVHTFDAIDTLIALNEFTRAQLIEGRFSSGKIRVVPNFIAAGDSRTIDTKEDYAVYIGRLSGEKGLETLVRAFQKVPTGLRLKILGAGPLEQSLRRRIAGDAAAGITMAGFVAGEEKVRSLARARFSIVPSEWYENFPLSVLESFSAGTPVIASRIGGLPEIVEEGKSGLLYRAGDADDLADKVRYLAAHPDEAVAMGRYARQQVLSAYSAEAHYRALIAVYEDTLRRYGGAGRTGEAGG